MEQDLESFLVLVDSTELPYNLYFKVKGFYFKKSYKLPWQFLASMLLKISKVVGT